MPGKKVKEESVVYNKAVFKEDSFYKINVGDEFEVLVNEGDKVKAKSVIAQKKVEAERIIEIPYDGEPEVSVGENVKKGMALYVKGKFIPKKVFSDVTGVVKEISKTNIRISVKEKIEQSDSNITTPFEADVVSVSKNGVVLKFSAIHINLFDTKGESAIGPIVYLESSKIKPGKIDDSKIKGSIIVTDKITFDIYPLLSTLGAKGIVANSVDYYLYRDIIILAVPVGIISGFGKLSEDAAIKEYFSSIESDGRKFAWLDTSYDRLVVVEKSVPKWVKSHEFDLKEIGIL